MTPSCSSEEWYDICMRLGSTNLAPQAPLKNLRMALYAVKVVG